MVDVVDDDLNRTGVIVHTATHRSDAHFPIGGATTPTRTSQDERRLFDTVGHRLARKAMPTDPQRQRISITARADSTAHAWLDLPESGIN